MYVAAAWALSQGIAQLGPLFHAPEWAMRWFVIACVVGFPFWIAFAWFYAWTPQGFKREEEVERDSALGRRTGRKLDFWIIGILAVAVVLLVTNQFALHRDATSQADAADAKAALAALAKVPEKSVAVLPLANEGGDPKQQYFSDGMSEELISDLTQLDGLKVIGKYSSFKFRDSKDSPAQIGATLGVANLIEGSVRQNAGRIRVVVNLIRAKDGASVWSHSYDQQLKDVFAIQSEIGKAVAAALQVKLLSQSLVDAQKPPSGNVEAYQLMLQGRALGQQGTKTGAEQEIALLEKAVKLASNYAYAWALLSNSRLNFALNYLHGGTRQLLVAKARTALDRATALAPDATIALTERAYQLSLLDFDQVGALAEYRRAAALAPNNPETKASLALQLIIMGQLQASVNLYRTAITSDPLHAGWYYNLSYPLASLGYLDQAEQALRKCLALQPSYRGAYAQIATLDILRSDYVTALHNADREPAPNFKAWALAAVAQISGGARQADTALRAYIDKYGGQESYGVAEIYAIRRQPDEMFQWLNRATVDSRADVVNNLLADPLILRYKDDPRFAALCKQLGLPSPGEPLPPVAASAP
jgi:TolB-like protein/Tfp pilus assembly protein PilF